MSETRFDGNINAPAGKVYCQQIAPSQACITDAMVAATSSSPIDGAKVGQENAAAAAGVQLFDPTTQCAAKTQTLGMAQNSGTILNFKAFVEVVGTGDRTVTVDVQRSTAGGAYATICSATITFAAAAGTTVRVAQAATLNSTTYVAGDIFRAVVTLGGTTGNYPQGLTVNLVLKENPQ